MRTIPRVTFLVTANIVWFAQFAAAVLAVVPADYVEWWRRQAPNLQLGCFEDTLRYDLLDRLFVFGLVWLISTPLMNIVAWRFPERWPSRLTRLWWNPAAPGLSLLTAVTVLSLMAWLGSDMLSAPVTSSVIFAGARLITVSGAAFYYRAVVLSAAEGNSRPGVRDGA